jgi:transposase
MLPGPARQPTLRRQTAEQAPRRRQYAEQCWLAGPALSAFVKSSIERTLKFLVTEADLLFEEIERVIRSDEKLSASSKLVQTIPGIGKRISLYLIALVPDIGRFKSARALSAFLACAPGRAQSGTSLDKTRISNRGHTWFRAALWLPAMTAKRCNPSCRPLVRRLEEAGKTPAAITGAVCRKLVHIAFGVLSSGEAYNAQHTSFSLPASASPGGTAAGR